MSVAKRCGKLLFSLAVSVVALFVFCACSVLEGEKQVFINISEEQLVLAAGDEAQLTAVASDAKAVGWSSSAPEVASVSAEGKVKAISEGEAVVTASSAGGKAQASCLVVVLSAPAVEGYTLVWHDEFDGDAIDSEKWGFRTGVRDTYGSSTGPLYWGNNELQYYTQDAVRVADGVLTITATKEPMPEGRSYSSGRILTRDKFSFTYGYIEARMQTPAEAGMWPAFWMLPQPSGTQNDNNEYGWWAANGEIDIMEAKGRLSNVADQTLHFGNKGASTYATNSTEVSGSTQEWHVYGLEWTPDYIAWFIDGAEVFRVENARWWTESVSKQENPYAPFDKDFYILFNLAVGGNYDGGTSPSEDFVCASMCIDYVRVYQ